ncbi:MAG: hypothetical protein MPW16_15275 [Candidatus Manganitrophus sp.]|nr:MAG: hypothetical protein MPW16_15275 [Candidatus Manganitrophus sp.]
MGAVDIEEGRSQRDPVEGFGRRRKQHRPALPGDAPLRRVEAGGLLRLKRRLLRHIPGAPRQGHHPGDPGKEDGAEKIRAQDVHSVSTSTAPAS